MFSWGVWIVFAPYATIYGNPYEFIAIFVLNYKSFWNYIFLLIYLKARRNRCFITIFISINIATFWCFNIIFIKCCSLITCNAIWCICIIYINRSGIRVIIFRTFTCLCNGKYRFSSIIIVANFIFQCSIAYIFPIVFIITRIYNSRIIVVWVWKRS